MTIAKLIPPVINARTVLDKLTCTRPVRRDRFNISYQIKGSKKVFHCYGHGGSGWTTLFGSVNRALHLFEEKFPNCALPIRVIGAGCMGLTIAIELKRRGYKVAGITAKEEYDLPSWRAAGYFACVSIKTCLEEEQNLYKIGVETYQTCTAISQGKHPYLTQETVISKPVYCHQETESGVEEFAKRGFIPAKKSVILDFGNGVQHPDFVKYWTYFMDTTALMKQLRAEMQRLKIPLTHQKIGSFEEIAEEVIFNCSGLGGRDLNGDAEVFPVRGHLILLNEHSGHEHLEYMIYTNVLQEGNWERVYLFPKTCSVTSEEREGVSCYGALGGTFVEHEDRLSPQELKALDEEEFRKLLDRTSLFFQGCQFR